MCLPDRRVSPSVCCEDAGSVSIISKLTPNNIRDRQQKAGHLLIIPFTEIICVRIMFIATF